MRKRDKESLDHFRRFGPYEYAYNITRDMREVYFLVIRGKKIPVSGVVFDALCKLKLIQRKY
jgi:hypothetical protein